MKNDFNTFKPAMMIAGVTILCLLPFVNKAFHIDDPIYLRCAQQIVKHPFDFYGFDFNWYGHWQPMYSVNQNPPLVSYYMALVGAIFGWGEVVLHLSFYVIAVCLLIGVYYLANLLSPSPRIATLIVAVSPVFMVSATTIMADVLMLCFYVWAVYCWVHAVKKDASVFYFFSSILISCSILTKYYAVSLIPLLFAYSFAVKRKLDRTLLYLLIPVGTIIAYQSITQLLYGTLLLSNAASYAASRGIAGSVSEFVKKTLIGLSFSGGCMASLLFLIPLLWSKRVVFASAIFLFSFFSLSFMVEPATWKTLLGWGELRPEIVTQYCLFVLLGIQLLSLPVIAATVDRDADSFLLLLWILGTFVFAAHVNWTTNARASFPMVPAVAILVARRLHDRWPTARKHVFPMAMLAAVLLSLAVVWADQSLANAQRLEANEASRKFNRYPGKIWFLGHWGFQYYMEEMGAEAIDYKTSKIRTGDIIVIPKNNTNLRLFAPPYRSKYKLIAKRKRTLFPWIETMSMTRIASFYSSMWGSAPFLFKPSDPEEYYYFLAGDFSPEEHDDEAIDYEID